ncbi:MULTISPECIES: phage portal protein [unclassified Ruminococcus]|uniref:phage portal protein n=1 Tax=unclassified Ruminococcus TaxID=2608920 RepID=UPI00210A8C65|nr:MULTISPECIES: phage portal protein [unclassified Ruminococcus]MCQ4021524.1 serine/threonine protein phosphatase [Ruminococcus sp. zg-924]MCQ4113969.1 serine/threonine protein phosphatase [Ruminococcus sp. zg-921]
MRLFKKRTADKSDCAVQTAEGRFCRHPFGILSDYSSDLTQRRLYEALRESVPLIDGALDKIVRLTNGFEVHCKSKRAQAYLGSFLENVKVGASGRGIACFINTYLNQLLTYGTAVGEIVPYTDQSGIAALYNASLDAVELQCGDNPLDLQICARKDGGVSEPIKNPNLVLHTALNPSPDKVYGTSVLRGLPFVSDILLKIFNTIGENWERVGNIRFAVSCSSDGANAKERAQQIARQWSLAMSDKEQTRDFVSVGDVSIKVIGADNQILDSEVPVRQLLEQIVAKLSVPPFLLGLSWSSTERMASQQCDILTSELEWYRALITPVIDKICRLFLRMSGFDDNVEIEWGNINLQDETELAQARLWSAQAQEIELRIKEGKGE